jgi:hypothetical protein
LAGYTLKGILAKISEKFYHLVYNYSKSNMPTSHYFQLNEIVRLIVLTNPKKILDVGVGFGKYGFLSREYLELSDGQEKYNKWKRRIDGIEVFKGYITPIHELIYNHIYIGNAINILPTLKTKYDLILLVDVLEHFNYKEGVKLLEECKKRGKNIIISTPKKIGSQKKTFGNPFETHKFQWQAKHFEKFVSKFFIPNDYSLICFIGEDAFRVKKVFKNSQIKAKIKKIFPFLQPPYQILKKFLERL